MSAGETSKVILAPQPSESGTVITGSLPRTAALVALGSDDLELVGLLLKVIGWQTVTVAGFDDILSAKINLLVMDGSVLQAFLDLGADVSLGMACGVIVDHCDQKLLEAAVRAKVTCLIRPLDIAELESFIALAT